MDEDTKKQLLERWQTLIDDEYEAVKSTHTKKEFTFSATELRQLIRVVTIETLAKQEIDDLLNNNVLPRVGIQGNQEMKITYDPTVGRFCVFIPKDVKSTEDQPKTSSPQPPKAEQ